MLHDHLHNVVSALGTRVCGRSVSTSFRYRLRSSMQSPPQQKTEKTARIISRFDSLSAYCEVPDGSRLRRTEYGQICPRRKIFRQKRWFSQIFCLPLPCHWRFLLVLICSTKVSEKSDMAKSWAARLCRLPQQELFVAQELIKKFKLKYCGI